MKFEVLCFLLEVEILCFGFAVAGSPYFRFAVLCFVHDEVRFEIWCLKFDVLGLRFCILSLELQSCFDHSMARAIGPANF